MEKKFDRETLALMHDKYPNSATTELLDELERFYDMLESRKLIELPCKVGDTVWVLLNLLTGSHFIKPLIVKKIEVYADEIILILKHLDSNLEEYVSNNDLSDSWFLSKAQAEARLKELQEKRQREKYYIAAEHNEVQG